MLNLKKLTKIKTKNFLITCTSALSLIIIVWLLSSPTPHLRSFVSNTQLHIKNINSKLEMLEDEDGDSIFRKEKNLNNVDSTYLELLGFVKEPTLFENTQRELTNNLNNFNNRLNEQPRIPPLVTAFKRYGEKEKALIESKMKYFFNDLILIYDLDLSSSEQLLIKKQCNSSCTLKMFKTDKYPRHLVQSKMKAYKPIILQEVLNEYGALIWIETPNVFVSNDIDKYLDKAKQSGVLVWPKSQPVTQMSHPLMFKYFSTKPKDFYFIHMLDTTQFILYNNQNIHSKLMLPWVKCALRVECIAPRGSKYNGCDYSRRPTFLYSGCHRYEMSAFSIITAHLFYFDEKKYTMHNTENKENLTIYSSLGSLDQEITDMSTRLQREYKNSFMTILPNTFENQKSEKTKRT